MSHILTLMVVIIATMYNIYLVWLV